MTYQIHYTESDRKKVISRFDEKVVEQFEKRLEKKSQQLEWVNSLNKLSKRFHNFFGECDHHIAEIKFSVKSTEFRGLFLLLEEENTLAMVDVIEKEDYKGSRQEAVIQTVFDDRRKYRNSLSQKLEEEPLM